jgi:hypothetical protein
MTAKDKYLQKKYGITLADYEERLSAQGGVCKICGRPPKTVALSVDHDRKWNKLCTDIWKDSERYYAVIKKLPLGFARRYRGATGDGPTRKEARDGLRRELRLMSVRGLLCHRCNRGLRFYSDNPRSLESAALYLRTHQEGL